MYGWVDPVAVLGVTFAWMDDWGSHRISGVAVYIYDAEDPWGCT
jgi:hypothetical protein